MAELDLKVLERALMQVELVSTNTCIHALLFGVLP